MGCGSSRVAESNKDANATNASAAETKLITLQEEIPQHPVETIEIRQDESQREREKEGGSGGKIMNDVIENSIELPNKNEVDFIDHNDANTSNPVIHSKNGAGGPTKVRMSILTLPAPPKGHKHIDENCNLEETIKKLQEKTNYTHEQLLEFHRLYEKYKNHENDLDLDGFNKINEELGNHVVATFDLDEDNHFDICDTDDSHGISFPELVHYFYYFISNNEYFLGTPGQPDTRTHQTDYATSLINKKEPILEEEEDEETIPVKIIKRHESLYEAGTEIGDMMDDLLSKTGFTREDIMEYHALFLDHCLEDGELDVNGFNAINKTLHNKHIVTSLADVDDLCKFSAADADGSATIAFDELIKYLWFFKSSIY